MKGLLSLFVAWSSVAIGFAAHAQHQAYKPHDYKGKLSVGFILFPGYEPLDVHGTLELVYTLSFHYAIELAMIAMQKGPVSSRPPGDQYKDVIGPSTLATHSFADAPRLDILIVLGGRGTQALEDAGDTSVEDFVRERYSKLMYVLSVCTGAVSLAKAGVLEGRKATTNKSAWKWAAAHGKNVTWVPTARWVAQGNVWTSSGVSAGMDMIADFFKMFYGERDGFVTAALNEMEYAPNTHSGDDPFSVVLEVPGADKSLNLTVCARPAGH